MTHEANEDNQGRALTPHQQVQQELSTYWHNGKPRLKPLHHLERRLRPHGNTLDELREEFGLQTLLSPEGQLSRRVQFFAQFRDAVDEYGLVLPGNPEAYAAAADLHEAALNHLVALLNLSLPSLSERNIRAVWGITGSFMDRKPRLGISMVGVTYDEAQREYSHLLYPKTYHSPLPSDFDIGVAWQIRHDILHKDLLYRYFQDIYHEYGVYFESIMPKPDGDIEFLRLPENNSPGFLRNLLGIPTVG